MFQNLRANNQLFILHKEAKHYVEIGSVVSVSAPKPKYPMTQPLFWVQKNKGLDFPRQF